MGLAKGMRRVGLILPIVVDRNGERDRFRLVSGGRRLQAARMLQWKTIPAIEREHLSDAALRDIELEENENRKGFSEQERTKTFGASKRLVEAAEKAKEVLAQSAPEPNRKGTKGGQPKDPASTRAVAEALGTDRRTVERAQQHVSLAERWPWLQGPLWRQSDVLRAGERLEEFPEDQRDMVVGVLGCAKLMDPELAVTLLDNLRAMPVAERDEIYKLSQSDDPREISLALSRSAKNPPLPDPRIGILENVLRALSAAIKPFPKDPLTPKLGQIRKDLLAVKAEVKLVSYDVRRERGVTVQ